MCPIATYIYSTYFTTYSCNQHTKKLCIKKAINHVYYKYIPTLYALDSTCTHILDSSQCPHCSTNCSGRGTFISFTTCTTVCQVRGSSPVPSLLYTQSSTSCSIQSSTSDLSSFILFMTAGSTCKNVPNFLHLASNFPSRALITSTVHI